MGNSSTPDGGKLAGFIGFAAKRILLVIILAVAGLWILAQMVGFLDRTETPKQAINTEHQMGSNAHDVSEPFSGQHDTHNNNPNGSETAMPASGHDDTVSGHAAPTTAMVTPSGKMDHSTAMPVAKAADDHKKAASQTAHDADRAASVADHRPFQVPTVNKAKGVLFVEALIEPLTYELNERWWGWRPNDMINLTDNVNNEQMGVIEFTRRTAIVLMERISRTGATAAYDENLQLARSSFMINADQYWLPSPEDEYKKGLKNLKEYSLKLENGTANFFTRNDNLIPLLVVYEDLLGGCEENLVKQTEEDGESVSFYMADDYFYYAKGVARAMLPVLEAVAVDFASTIEARRGTDVIHHAIEGLHHAVNIEPFMITNSDLDGILANHRANMAAPISHARFYIGVLIKTLST